MKFTGVRIHTPLTRIRVGAEMPVMAMGTDEHQNPYSFGSAMPELEITWSATNKVRWNVCFVIF